MSSLNPSLPQRQFNPLGDLLSIVLRNDFCPTVYGLPRHPVIPGYVAPAAKTTARGQHTPDSLLNKISFKIRTTQNRVWILNIENDVWFK